MLLLGSVEKVRVRLILQLLLQVDLIHEVTEAMNLYLLYLVSVFSNFLVLVYVLELELTLHIELEGLYQIFIRVLLWFLIVFAMTLQLFFEPALVIHKLVLDLVLDIIEI